VKRCLVVMGIMVMRHWDKSSNNCWLAVVFIYHETKVICCSFWFVLRGE
jgi:hypothetical protein